MALLLAIEHVCLPFPNHVLAYAPWLPPTHADIQECFKNWLDELIRCIPKIGSAVCLLVPRRISAAKRILV